MGLLKIEPDGTKVYGPYVWRGSRRIVVFRYADGSGGSQAYARWWWLTNRGPIPEGMEVDHRDDDAMNDDPDNYQLLTRAENTTKANVARGSGTVTLPCAWCGDLLTREARTIRRNQGVRGCAGPFCGKSCARAHQALVCSGSYGEDPVGMGGRLESGVV